MLKVKSPMATNLLRVKWTDLAAENAAIERHGRDHGRHARYAPKLFSAASQPPRLPAIMSSPTKEAT